MQILTTGYGIQVNNGTSTAPTATGYTEVEVTGNTLRNLNGNWVHAIGLEGETPNVAAVFFEGNPFFFTGAVNNNNLSVTNTGYGIALHPTLATQYPSLSVDGECNW